MANPYTQIRMSIIRLLAADGLPCHNAFFDAQQTQQRYGIALSIGAGTFNGVPVVGDWIGEESIRVSLTLSFMSMRDTSQFEGLIWRVLQLLSRQQIDGAGMLVPLARGEITRGDDGVARCTLSFSVAAPLAVETEEKTTATPFNVAVFAAPVEEEDPPIAVFPVLDGGL